MKQPGIFGGSAAVAMLLAGGLTAAPVSVDENLLITDAAAFARGGGNGGGNGGDTGGDHGGGHGQTGDHGVAGGHDRTGNDHGHEVSSDAVSGKPGNRVGQSRQADRMIDDAVHDSSAFASRLGKLNAAHASATALANASEKSTVGMLGAYAREAQKGITVEEAIERLSQISNKHVDEDVVSAVDALLEGKVDLDEEAIDGEAGGETAAADSSTRDGADTGAAGTTTLAATEPSG